MSLTMEPGTTLGTEFLFAKDADGNTIPVVAVHPDIPRGPDDVTGPLELKLAPLTSIDTTPALIKPRSEGVTQFIIRNVGPGSLALGPANVTHETAAIILDVGQTYTDTVAAELEWYAVSDATTSIAMMVVAPR